VLVCVRAQPGPFGRAETPRLSADTGACIACCHAAIRA